MPSSKKFVNNKVGAIDKIFRIRRQFVNGLTKADKNK